MKNRKWSIKDKYPINSDSIGIEVVGKYKSNQWEVATQAQKDSIKNLIEILKAESSPKRFYKESYRDSKS